MNDDTNEFMEMMEGKEADTEPQQLKCSYVTEKYAPMRILLTSSRCRRSASWLYRGMVSDRIAFTMPLCERHKPKAVRSDPNSIFKFQLTPIKPLGSSENQPESLESNQDSLVMIVSHSNPELGEPI